MKTIILSDCHIGSPESNYRDVNRFLKDLDCSHLILAGDTWDLWDMSAGDIRDRHDDTVRLLKRLMDGGTKITTILGNHDEDYNDDPILGDEAVDSVELVLPNGKIYAVIHGQDFDPIYKKYNWLHRLLWCTNRFIKKLTGISLKSFMRSCTELREIDDQEYSGLVNDIHKHARKYYSNRGYDGLIMGHTHAPDHREGVKIDFWNSGDWKWSNTYVTIDGNDVKIDKFC